MVKVASTKIQPWTTNYPCQRFYGHKWLGPFNQALTSPGICIGGPAGVRRVRIGPGVRREMCPRSRPLRTEQPSLVSPQSVSPQCSRRTSQRAGPGRTERTITEESHGTLRQGHAPKASGESRPTAIRPGLRGAGPGPSIRDTQPRRPIRNGGQNSPRHAPENDSSSRRRRLNTPRAGGVQGPIQFTEIAPSNSHPREQKRDRQR